MDKEITEDQVGIDIPENIIAEVVQAHETQEGLALAVGHGAELPADTSSILTVEQAREVQARIEAEGLREFDWISSKVQMVGRAKRVMEATFQAIEGVGFLAPKELNGMLKSIESMDMLISGINKKSESIKKVQSVNLNITADYKDLVKAKRDAAAAMGKVIPDNEVPAGNLYKRALQSMGDED